MAHSIITKQFARTIWTKYIKALEEYKLISDGDIIYLAGSTEAKQTLANYLVEMTAEYGIRNITIVYDKEAEHNKIVAPESFHDIIYNNLWEMLYNGRIHSKIPKENKADVTIIRPLCLVRDEHILEWQQASGQKLSVADRSEELSLIKNLVDRLAAGNDAVENNIFASMSNVDIEMLPGHIKEGIHHSFLEWYDQKR